MITKEEVLDVQKQWSDGLLKIVAKHQNKEILHLKHLVLLMNFMPMVMERFCLSQL